MTTQWHDFFFAIICATGSLLGLLFVAVSINISKVAASPELSKAAMQPFFLLLAILIGSVYFLIPGQPAGLLGLEVLVTAFAVGAVMMRNDAWVLKRAPRRYRRKYIANIVFNQFPVFLVLVAGALLATGLQAGTFFMVPAIVLSFIQSITISWALLVSLHMHDGKGRWETGEEDGEPEKTVNPRT